MAECFHREAELVGEDYIIRCVDNYINIISYTTVIVEILDQRRRTIVSKLRELRS